ncbi:helix-turn-helix domain protein [Acidithrix ferrooxidans]|uniref:Helix-turn-helix domain protein n=2 Tax=Acidithrix ferrooxidans TaxID=1280514 RepID=A0A0D8HD52_9ACTN|nr:helix-turn-helix domain protein [Acidithrix ferrooxidans]
MQMPHITDPLESPRAAQIEELLQQIRKSHVAPRITLDGQKMGLPNEVNEAILDLLSRFGDGHGVIVASIDSLLTNSKAAELLGISRTYMDRLIDEGRIPAQYRCTRRRVKLSDVIEYMESSDRKRAEKLDAIAQLSERTGQYDNDAF